MILRRLLDLLERHLAIAERRSHNYERFVDTEVERGEHLRVLELAAAKREIAEAARRHESTASVTHVYERLTAIEAALSMGAGTATVENALKDVREVRERVVKLQEVNPFLERRLNILEAARSDAAQTKSVTP